MSFVIPLKAKEENLLADFAENFLKPHQDIWILRWNTLAAAHLKIPKSQKQLLHLPDRFVPSVVNALILKRFNTIYQRYSYLGWQIAHAGLSFETGLSLIGFQMVSLLAVVEELSQPKSKKVKQNGKGRIQEYLVAYSRFQQNIRHSFLQGYFEVRSAHNGTLKEELEEHLQTSKLRQKEESFLREILRGTAQYLDFDELFKVFSRSLRETGNYDWLSISLKREDPDEVEIIAVNVEEPSTLKKGVYRDPHLPAVLVLREKKPMIVSDLSRETKSSFLSQLSKEGQKSCVVIPLLIGGEAIGSLNIASKNKNFFQESELPFFQRLADGLAVAVKNSTEHSRILERLEMQRCASQIISKIHSTLIRQEMLQTVLTELAHCTKADRVFFGEAVEPEGLCRIEEEYLKPDSALKEIPSAKGTHQLADFKEAVEILRKGEVIAAHTEGEVHSVLRRPQKILLDLKVKTTCLAPIFVNQKYWGVLGIHHCAEPYTYKKIEMEMLKELTKEIGKAIENCAIYEKEKENVARLENMLQSKGGEGGKE